MKGMRPLAALVLLGTVLISFRSHSAEGDGPPKCNPQTDLARVQQENPKASKECVQETQRADDCCNKPNNEKCGYKESNFGNAPVEAEKDPNSAYGAAVKQTRTLVLSSNRNQMFAAVCRGARKKAKEACDKAIKSSLDKTLSGDPNGEDLDQQLKQTSAFKERMSEKLQARERCHSDQSAADLNEAKESMKTANKSAGDAVWRSTCARSNIGGEAFSQCYLYNDGHSGAQIVEGSEKDKLPVDTTQIGYCAGIKGQDVGASAAHCGQSEHTSTEVDSTGETKHSKWKPAEGKDTGFNLEKFKNGEGYDDTKIYEVDGESSKGKPYYVLSEDKNLASGCEIRNDRVMACSTQSLQQMQGKTANIQAYPNDYFRNGNRDASSSVLVSSGPAFYDSKNGRVYVNAFGAPGSSGGAIYLKPGSEIGGVVSDRPILLGPASGALWQDNPVTKQAVDGSSLGFTQRTTWVPISSYQTVNQLYVPKVSDTTLNQGQKIFVPIPRPRPK